MTGFKTIPQGERGMIRNRNGRIRYIDGPRRPFLFHEHLELMRRFTAEPEQYLAIRHKDGTVDNLPGPVSVWFDPVEHRGITVETATKIDSNEALVVYRQTDAGVARRVVRGPALFTPTAQEWVHEFSWHGTDPKQGHCKVPHALRFTKLLVIPDQMYFDVQNVRTKDDALLVIKLMVFFELRDIETMLDQTHDPVADFINALSADVIDFAGGRDFETFKAQTEALNRLDTFPQLTQRAEKIGYRITKLVYRGYYASDKLQMMHDAAIECRTKLHLEEETERQAQEMADLKLAREQTRAAKRQEMEQDDTVHQNRLKQLQAEAEIARRDAEQKQALEAAQREQAQKLETLRRNNEVALAHDKARHEEQIAHFTRMHGLQVDLTRYLVAQYQNPDKVIRIDGVKQPQLHLHEN
jgi:hypothetical protein